MIAEAAYYLAQKRGFLGTHALDDWLAAEQQIRQEISPILDSEVIMKNPAQNQTKPGASTPQQHRQDSRSRFENFAATQAAGDGIQGDTLKKDKTVDEKISANMADRK